MKRLITFVLALSLSVTPVLGATDAELKAKADYWLNKGWYLADGGLKDGADYYFCDKAESYIEQIQNEALKRDLWAVSHATREALDNRQGTFYGVCRITAYCSCAKCCGKWAGSPTASGSIPVEGRTVANGSLPFGTKVTIDGHTYVVEDRGVNGDQFDIYFDDHGEALRYGMRYTEVYLEE